MRELFIISLMITLAGAIFSFDPFNTCCTTTTTTTTPDPCTTTTTNGYQAMGWETDDDGNVYMGDDDAKIYLLLMPAAKYWQPLPKDWPEASIFGSQYPDSPDYRGPCQGCDCMKRKKQRT